MMRVSWLPADSHVPGHRVTYTTNHGSDVKQVKLLRAQQAFSLLLTYLGCKV